MSRFWSMQRMIVTCAVLATAISAIAQAQSPTKLNEIMINPGTDGDDEEYVEFFGTGGAGTINSTVANGPTYWFVALENENSNNEGSVDLVFKLSGNQDANNIFWMAPSDSDYDGSGSPPAPDGVWTANDKLEQSGATYFLIQVAQGTAASDLPDHANQSDWDSNDDGIINGTVATLLGGTPDTIPFFL